ncbi:jg21589 [Pararge aegeria aegeria]|uniref:Jg21589 protein n=1 Tax=Pararge aegeria aegeria TaxID=348720 RepID=A0A8S4SHP4_9NEOP|nr:jg21589 [Pararge aegeria aegeria]
MTHVNTGDLLNFQDYSPEHNERSARIDVEAVHTNQYNTMSTSNYNYEEPTPVEEQETQPSQTNHNFWTIEYYQKYFDVQTSEVVERIISSVLPQKVSRNYFDERIKGKPDFIKANKFEKIYSTSQFPYKKLYGVKLWGTASSSSSSVPGPFPHLVGLGLSVVRMATDAAPRWITPASRARSKRLVGRPGRRVLHGVLLRSQALWAALKWTSTNDNQDEIETQASSSPSMISLFCLYGYSLSIYIPVAVLWTIQVSWLQWLFVLMAAFVSGAVLIFWLLPALKKSKYFLILIGSILAFHFLLATGFMLYFFHVPDTASAVALKVLTTLPATQL